MTMNASDLHFKARRRNNQLILASAATTVISLHLLGYGYETKLAAAALFSAPLVRNYIRSVQERQGDAEPEWLQECAQAVVERRDFPSLPFENPFDVSQGTLDIEQRITLAAAASREFGRRVSVIHFQFHGADDAAVEAAAAALRARLRRTDFVEAIGDGQVVICLNMVRDVPEVYTVLARLKGELDNSLVGGKQWTVGGAMYPLHGYNGADLIHAAREHGRKRLILPQEILSLAS